MASNDLTGSVTQWIQDVRTGEEDAARKLWERYFQRLVDLAHRKMHSVPKQESDEEDVVIQALNSFFGGARQGRFPRLADRNDLWSLLASIVEHKAQKVRRRQSALKRGGAKTRVDLDFDNQIADPVAPSLGDLNLELRELLSQLRDDCLREIVVLVLYGHTNAEIAEKLDVHERTVERRRLIVRKRWQAELIS